MTAHQPLPDLLGRRDEEHGTWDVRPCAPVRGEPKTAIIDRIMLAPTDDDAKARVIRAHEMMHARITPGQHWPEWISRAQASDEALRAAEEFRVNWLCQEAGFDVKTFLTDGTEKAAGERLAEVGNWAGAVYFAAACAGTASMSPFLVGIRRHQRDWAPVLREIEKRLLREAKKVSCRTLGSTEKVSGSTLAPRGFLYTEAWAVMLDGLANPPVDEDDTADGTSDASGAADGRSDTKTIEPGAAKHGAPPVTAQQVKKECKPEVATGEWPEVRVARLPLTRPAPGGLGRKRRAADRGRAPRRIHRMLTDPQRRVFDQNRRGNGGVVLVDGSGSMRLTEDDVRKILEAAPGATVAVYACSSGREPENLWVLAHRGKMTEKIPDRPAGNGVDFPAIQWALQQRQHSSAPVVWITDGGVHYAGRSGYSHRAALDCTQAAVTNKVIVRPDVETALHALRELAARRTPSRWYPYVWRDSWLTLRGTVLRSHLDLSGGFYLR